MIYNDIANIVLYQGDDIDLVATVQDGDGNPLDVSGAQSIEWAIAKEVDGVAETTKTLGAGITVNNPETFTVTIDSALTSTLAGVYYPELDYSLIKRPSNAAIKNSYYHECRVTNSAGLQSVVFSGRLFIRKSLLEV